MRLAETLIGLALMLVLMTGLVMLVQQTARLARTQPDRFEAQQRARVALDLVTRDLRSAGAGVDRGPATGPLASTFPAVWPRKLRRGGDGPAVVRDDALTMLAVPDTLAQTVAAGEVRPLASRLDVEAAAHCPAARPACGFSAGTTFGVFDPVGTLMLWRTESVTDRTLSVRPLVMPDEGLGSGAVVSELLVRGYAHDPVTRQLRYFDGDAANQPVIDGVVSWSVRYFDDAGELPLAVLADGPWRSSGATQFDVDLLRVRRIQVSLQVEAGTATHRAVADVALRNPGRSRGIAP